MMMRQNRNQPPKRWQRRLKFHVSLPSGRGENVSVLELGTVVDLENSCTKVPGATLSETCCTGSSRSTFWANGDSLAAIALQPKIAATCRAFALWVVGGDKIVTWGHPDYGDNK